jgi:membrane-associated phospholipid phosphatase
MVPAVGAVMLLLTLAIAWVRVAAGVHYPSDVAAGGILGVLIGLIFFL